MLVRLNPHLVVPQMLPFLVGIQTRGWLSLSEPCSLSLSQPRVLVRRLFKENSVAVRLYTPGASALRTPPKLTIVSTTFIESVHVTILHQNGLCTFGSNLCHDYRITLWHIVLYWYLYMKMLLRH